MSVSKARFLVGEWRVDPSLNLIENGDTRRLEPRVMEVLVFFAQHPNEVLSKDEILEAVWAGDFVGEEALTYSISELRKALGDTARDPSYIETIPRRGYRLIAPVSFSEKEPSKSWRFPPVMSRSMIPLLVMLAVIVFALASLFLWRGLVGTDGDAALESVRFHVRPPGVTYGMVDNVALSPDDKYLAFTGLKDGKRLLWIRPLDSFTAYSVAGTEGATAPFWSPDGRAVGFFADRALKTVDVKDGTVALLSKVDGLAGTWGVGGSILVTMIPSRGESPIMSVSTDDGRAQPVQLSPFEDHEEDLLPFPISLRFLPGGEHFLFSDNNDYSLWLADLVSKEMRPLLNTSTAKAVPVRPNLLVYSKDNVLLAQPFDMRTHTFTGSAVRIADGLRSFRWFHSYFDATGENLAYRVESSRQEELVWVDRQGHRLSSVGEPASYLQIRLSPDERRIAVTLDPRGSWDLDIWVLDLESGVQSRLTDREGMDVDPVWSPDSTRIAYSTGYDNSVRLREIGEAGDEHFFQVGSSEIESKPDDWSSDGSTLLVRGPENKVFQTFYPSGTSRLWLDAKAKVDQCRFSPDGKWVAYGSDESGRWEVYVAAFPRFGRKQQVSKGGGGQPVWRDDGRELFYLTEDGHIVSVPITQSGNRLEFGPPEPLFQSEVRVDFNVDQYAVSEDGQRFLVIQPLADEEPIALIKNWRANLEF